MPETRSRTRGTLTVVADTEDRVTMLSRTLGFDDPDGRT
jgi:hypothetical protein